MPRQPVGNVTEHRVTLGDFERKELQAFLKQQARDDDFDAVFQTVQIMAMPVAVVGVGFLGYLGMVNLFSGINVLSNWWKGRVAKAGAAVEEAITESPLFVADDMEGGGVTGGVYGGSVFM